MSGLPICEKLEAGANSIAIDGTPSQVGPTPEELHEAANTIEALYSLAEQFVRVAEYEIKKMQREKPEDDEGIRLRTLNLNLIRDTLSKYRGDAA